jgi:hypothetical protein
MDIEEQRALARTRHFQDLPVCGKAMELAHEVYAGAEPLPQAETFGLSMQIRRSLRGGCATS